MRILIIEDEKELANLVRDALQKESYAVDSAYDGKQGEELALSESYDAIILDIMLPEKNGLEVLATIREEGIDVPVLLLTARDEVADRVAGLNAGADDYLGKPFAIAELRARLQALLRRQTNVRGPLLCAGDLVMDPVSHEVHLGEQQIKLNSREYAILEYSLRNKGRVLSKGMIAEHVWDYHFDSDFNLIEVYIRRLRQKFEQASGRRIIETVRNRGYIIREPNV